MKNIKYFLLTTTIILFGSLSLVAKADGGSLVKNGGRGVVCIRESIVSRVTFDYEKMRFNSFGRSLVNQVEPLEYFLSKNNYQKGSVFERIKELSFDESLKVLHDVFKPYPWFYQSLLAAHEYLGSIERMASMSHDGVVSSSDALNITNTAINCAHQQIIVSEADFFAIDALYWSFLTPSQKAIMQLHEEIYYLARFPRNLPRIYFGPLLDGSSATTRLISSVLMTNTPEVDIPKAFKKSRFIFEPFLFDPPLGTKPAPIP